VTAAIGWLLGTVPGRVVVGVVGVLALVLGLLWGWRRQEARIAEAQTARAIAEGDVAKHKLAYENQAKKVDELERKLKEVSRRRFTTTETTPDGTVRTTTSEYEDSKESTDRRTRTQEEPRLPEAPAAVWSGGLLLGGGWLEPGASAAVGGIARLGRRTPVAAWGQVVGHWDGKPRIDGGLAGLAWTF
jgi:hypothetical protein